MAGRFADCNTELIESFRENATNKNTNMSTNNWFRVWYAWAEEIGHSNKKIEEFESDELNKLLEEFYATVVKQDGSSYEPDSLRVMANSLDRHLKEEGYQFSIMRDVAFFSSKQVLEGKARALRDEGKGKRPNKSRSLTSKDEKELWDKQSLGNHNPQVLVQTILWYLAQYFGLRGRQEHHSMKEEDFTFGSDENGKEYVEFVENPAKTRQAGLKAMPRSFLPKMFSTGDDNCPVKIFKEFLSRRPLEMRSTGPLYLA